MNPYEQEQLRELHDKFGKHHIEKKYRVQSNSGSHFSYIGLCECGAFLICDETYKRGAAMNLFSRKHFKARKRRINNDSWQTSVYEVLQQDEELMESYKRLPYVSEEYKENLINKEIDEAKKLERDYFGTLI